MADIVGYFAWEKNQKGTANPVKYHAYRETNMMPETKARYQSLILAKHPLNQQEWKLSLDRLAYKYPCPPLPPIREKKQEET